MLGSESSQRVATVLTAAGVLILGLAGVCFMLIGLVTILCGSFHWFLALVLSVSAVWLLSKRINWVWLRNLVRAFAFAFAFTPFIPHPGVEWSLPWPTAGMWVLTSLSDGKLLAFETVSILVATLVIWWAGSAVHCGRYGHEITQGRKASGPQGRSFAP